ncbi:MAG: hypothetical protein WCD73_18885, partial [Pseudolabrys sp.]
APCCPDNVRGQRMRFAYIAIFPICIASFATSVQAEDSNTDKSVYSTGRTQTPETKGQKQPQGWTGPIETGTGGAPPESPQGQSPPGMQPAPEGSSKTTVAPDK